MRLLDAGAVVYVCGDARGMARGVADAFTRALCAEKGSSCHSEKSSSRSLFRADDDAVQLTSEKFRVPEILTKTNPRASKSSCIHGQSGREIF